MAIHECEFCKKIFANKSNMNVHKNTAKYCITARQTAKVCEFPCEYCLYIFATERCLSSHTKVCKTKKAQDNIAMKTENMMLNKRVIELEIKLESKTIELDNLSKLLKMSQSCVEEIAKQPKITTNNKINNKVSILTPLDLSADRLRELVEANFTNSHLLEGQKGVARFTVEHIIKDDDGKLQYICTDPARHTFRFKDGDTEIKDIRGKRLSSALVPPGMNKTGRLGMDAIKDNPSLFEIDSDSQQSI